MNSRELSKLIKDYYNINGNRSGGNCHIVLDDFNVKDSDIDFCIKECEKKNDNDGIVIMNFMKNIRKTARLKAIKYSNKLGDF